MQALCEELRARTGNPPLDYIIKQLYHSLSSYMADIRLGATHLVGYGSSYTTRARGIIVKYTGCPKKPENY